MTVSKAKKKYDELTLQKDQLQRLVNESKAIAMTYAPRVVIKIEPAVNPRRENVPSQKEPIVIELE